MNKSTLVLLAVATTAFAVGCGKQQTTHRESIEAKANVIAAAAITESFTPVINKTPAPNDGLATVDNYLVAIRKTALDKEFLIRASVIRQFADATSEGLQARIVAFKKFANKVYMIEANEGHVVTSDLPVTRLLAEFPVVRETDDMVVIDFNAGMKKIFVTGSVGASDFSGKDYAVNLAAVEIASGFVQKVEIKNNTLMVSQIAQLDLRGNFPTYEVRYFISSYRENPSFKAKETSDFRDVAYFEANAELENHTGRSVVRIAKWDFSKPVTYHISANTPEAYVEAVRDGILYWNQVLGREVLKAEVAPKGVTAPDANYNVVQWVPFDNGMGAYADMLVDPRTGEILNAQVYFHSAWITAPRDSLPGLLRQLGLSPLAPAKPAAPTIVASDVSALSGYRSTRLCEHRAGLDAATTAVDHLLEMGASAEVVQRAAKDVVRMIIAHEVGHTLGLRHNFAGSLGMTYAPKDRDKAFLDYLVTDATPAPEQVITTSVMDYLPLQDVMLVGRAIRQKTASLAYDKGALAWGYDDVELDTKTAAPFCTDSGTRAYIDCATGDYGPKPLVAASYNLNRIVEQLPALIIEAYVGVKAPADPRDKVKIERIAFSPEGIADAIVMRYAAQLPWLVENGAPFTLLTQRQFPPVTSLNKEEVTAFQNQSTFAQVTEAGGIKSVMFSYLPTTAKPLSEMAATFTTKANEYLDKNKSGLGTNGKEYQFTDAEVDFIKKYLAKLMPKVEELILEKTVDVLARTGKFTAATYASELEESLANTADALILTQTTTSVPDSAGAAFQFRYKKEMRARAVALLGLNSGGTNAAWGATRKAQIKTKLGEIIEKTTVKKIADINDLYLNTLPTTFKQWVVEQRSLYNAL